MKVLLINPPHEYGGSNRAPEVFPLGLGYIATALLKGGHEVEVLDIYAHQYMQQEVEQKIKGSSYGVVGIGALSTQYQYIKWLTAQLRKYHEGKIVLGNALATLTPEIVLKNTETDICVMGEGETTITELVDNLDNPEKVKGICFKRDGAVVKNPPREYIEDLDSTGLPAWGLFPIEIYLRHAFLFRHPFVKTASIITGRGCPYSCNFCSKIFKGVRFRSVDNVIEEIRELKQRYGVRGIVFQDDLITVNKERLYELCQKIKPLNLKWQVEGGRVNLIDLDLLRAMKEAGCVAIGYGIESGSQVILDNMNKKITVEQAERVLNDTVRVGMRPIVFLMYGYIGETRQTVEETVRFIQRVPVSGPVFMAPTTPLPGTKLYDHALERGLIGDEEEYLERLRDGFAGFEGAPLVNLTQFTEEEFSQLKRDAERRINLAQIRKRPFSFLREWLLAGLHYLHAFGVIKGLKIGLAEVIKRFR